MRKDIVELVCRWTAAFSEVGGLFGSAIAETRRSWPISTLPAFAVARLACVCGSG